MTIDKSLKIGDTVKVVLGEHDYVSSRKYIGQKGTIIYISSSDDPLITVQFSGKSMSFFTEELEKARTRKAKVVVNG